MSAPTFAPADRIEHAAAEWWVRLRDPALPDQALAQWTDWLEADPRHAAAFDRACALAEQASRMPAEQRTDLVARFAAPNPAVACRRVPRFPLALAAGLAAILVVAGGLFLGSRHGPSAQRAYASDHASHRDIDLPDGSSIELGGATTITARYDHDIRAIDLDAGEAFFRVAHAERPFVVTAGPLRIRDLGTAFNVRRTGDRVTVAVTEGRVRVSPSANDSDGGTVELGAGREVSFDPETRAMHILDVDPTVATAWRENRLEFVNEPLSSVLENVNRYSKRPIHVSDPMVARLTFTGTVQVDTIDSWVAALPRVFPVRVDTFADHLELSRQTSMARGQKPR
jgi:transmembrane sensor